MYELINTLQHIPSLYLSSNKRYYISNLGPKCFLLKCIWEILGSDRGVDKHPSLLTFYALSTDK
jgi:hypothetical protein